MTVSFSTRNQRWMAWSGLVCTALFLVGFAVVAEWLPPVSPNDSLEKTVGFFSEDETRKRIGLWMNTFAGALSGVWVVAISIQMKRIEGRLASLAWVNVMMGALLVFEFIIPVQLWQACLYRPELDPEFTYRLNDFAWLFFVGVVSTAAVQGVVIGVAILQDQRNEPVFPRWVGYFNLWCALLFCPGGLVVFFKSGPFAWNGAIAFWLVLVVFSLWLIVMSVALLKYAIPHQEREEAKGRADEAVVREQVAA